MLPGLLGPLMLQFLLISNGAGRFYLPAVLVIVTLVVVKDWDSGCAVSEFPVSLLLGIKVPCLDVKAARDATGPPHLWPKLCFSTGFSPPGDAPAAPHYPQEHYPLESRTAAD